MMEQSTLRQPQEYLAKGRDGHEISILYYPAASDHAPLLIEVHGGGFILGHHRTDIELCQLLNNGAQVNVASIEYRYAPQVSYPYATYDCYDAMLWLCENRRIRFDRSRIYLMGHSAGGNIVAGMSLLSTGVLDISGQILNYPYLDSHIDPSLREKPKFSIPGFFVRYFNNKYFPDHELRKHPLASPVRMTKEQASKMPPTLVITCEHDCLRQDGRKYAQLLKSAGTPVQFIEYKNALHGFIENTPNGKINQLWWMGRNFVLQQKDIFDQAFTHMCDFIKVQTVSRTQLIRET